jgi:hypothetical protein
VIVVDPATAGAAIVTDPEVDPNNARLLERLTIWAVSIATAVVPPVCKDRVATESPVVTTPLVVALIVEAMNLP